MCLVRNVKCIEAPFLQTSYSTLLFYLNPKHPKKIFFFFYDFWNFYALVRGGQNKLDFLYHTDISANMLMFQLWQIVSETIISKPLSHQISHELLGDKCNASQLLAATSLFFLFFFYIHSTWIVLSPSECEFWARAEKSFMMEPSG